MIARRFLSMAALGWLFLSPSGPASAADNVPASVWNGADMRPVNGLPDGHYALDRLSDGTGVAAWYGAPTARYQHAILGDDIEAGSLHVAFQDGRHYDLFLPFDQVFEDRTPRIVDLDGDGEIEIVAIRSFQDAGGSVALYGVRDGKLMELAATAPIGRTNRWLNIAGIADYAGRGSKQIAYVETPHIGGTLHVVDWQGKTLVPLASLRGFSNHKIGSRHQDLSADIAWTGKRPPELVVPSDNLRSLRIVGFSENSLEELDRIYLPARVLKRAAPAKGQAPGCVRFRLENGDDATVCPPG